jgi:hypothetical protein
MPESKFRFEQPASDKPAMRGPGIEVDFDFNQKSGWVHRLRFDDGSTKMSDTRRWLVRPVTPIEIEIEPVTPRRIANPVYQALVPHELPGERGPGLCALLTGSCFDHHFSAVFRLFPDPVTPAQVIFEVDLADRCRGSIEELAATYMISEAAGSARPTSACSSRVAWQGTATSNGSLELLAMPPTVIGDPTSLSTATRVQVQARIDPGTHTQRLHYRWRWASRAGLTR